MREEAMPKRQNRRGSVDKSAADTASRTVDAIDSEYFRAKKGGDSFGYLVRETNRHFARMLQHFIEQHGITTAQWYFLRVLWEQDGLTQAELSSRVGLMTPTTVAALNTLERKGLIKRHRHPTDGRKVAVYLTRAGRQLERNGLASGKEVNVIATQGLSAEAIEVTRQALRTMCENLAGRMKQSV
jgi:DNA-binding MarR family transcriptional regulator